MREQTPEAYLDFFEASNGANGVEWNQRFIAALSQHGLMLIDCPDEKLSYDARYPDGQPYQAPFPSEGPIRWEERSLIVWI